MDQAAEKFILLKFNLNTASVVAISHIYAMLYNISTVF